MEKGPNLARALSLIVAKANAVPALFLFSASRVALAWQTFGEGEEAVSTSVTCQANIGCLAVALKPDDA